MPVEALLKILRDPPAVVKRYCKVFLCGRVTVVGGLARPGGRLFIILRNASAFEVHDPKIGLRRDVPLVGRLPIPGHSLVIVSRHAPPKLIM